MENMKGPKAQNGQLIGTSSHTHTYTDEEETPSGEIFILPPTASILPWVTTGM